MPGERRFGDRRARPRFEIVGQLFGSLEVIEHLAVRNVGRDGALVESQALLPPDSVRSVRLALYGTVVDVVVRVRHVTPIQAPGGARRYLIGLEFERLQPLAMEQIDQLIAASGGPVPVRHHHESGA